MSLFLYTSLLKKNSLLLLDNKEDYSKSIKKEKEGYVVISCHLFTRKEIDTILTPEKLPCSTR